MELAVGWAAVEAHRNQTCALPRVPGMAQRRGGWMGGEVAGGGRGPPKPDLCIASSPWHGAGTGLKG
eukprot:362930-Chlamydomonas_euryale.AAC.10